MFAVFRGGVEEYCACVRTFSHAGWFRDEFASSVPVIHGRQEGPLSARFFSGRARHLPVTGRARLQAALVICSNTAQLCPAEPRCLR